MTPTSQLALDWDTLTSVLARQGVDCPAALTPVRLQTTPETLKTLAEVEARVAALEADWTGWSRRESAVSRPPREGWPEPGAGPPLDGEWVDGATSVRLLRAGDSWRLITVAEVERGGVEALREEQTLLAADGGVLTYAVYWGVPAGGDGALRRLAYRFTGLDEG